MKTVREYSGYILDVPNWPPVQGLEIGLVAILIANILIGIWDVTSKNKQG